MRLWEVARFEVAYQARRPWTWAYFAALFAISLQITVEAYAGNARDDGYFFNAPFVVASVTMLASAMGLLVAAALAGDAGARDASTRMHALLYTSPVGRRAYLGGRFLGALALGALMMLAPQLALLLSPLLPGLPPEVLGPFRPGAYLGAYLLIALPNAFVATALLFALSALSRRALASYLGAVLVFFASMLVWRLVAIKFGHWELAKLLDPLGLTVMSAVSRTTTAAGRNALSIAHMDSLLPSRALWTCVALGALALAYARFRFEHAAAGGAGGRGAADAASPATDRVRPIAVPRARRSFRAPTRSRQVLVLAAESFRAVALSWGGLALAALATTLVVLGPQAMNHMDVPLVPTTQQMTSWVGNTGEILWTIVPLLTVFYVGELVWREREAGLSEIADAAPVPEWARFAGRFAGLALVLAAYQAMLLAGCLLVQVQLGYRDFELGLYARVLFGLQLAEHLLFALLAFAVHVLANQKYVGYLVALAAYAVTAFAPSLGVEHRLLVYGASPEWAYTDMRGFGPSLAPWAWFKLYWGAWSLLLAVAVRLLWVRGTEQGLAVRLRVARGRLTPRVAGVAATAAALVLALGGFVFYNTNVLNAYESADGRAARRAEYERRYARFALAPQPHLTGVRLHAELRPERREVTVRGTYRLVNGSDARIDSIHLAPRWGVETGPARFDRPAERVLNDERLGHRIYVLRRPLFPGDSLRLDFDVRFRPRGFTNDGADLAVAEAATYLEGHDLLPEIGYQRARELAGASDRLAHGLPPRPAVRALEDVAARSDVAGDEWVAFEAVVGTSDGQTALAPGALRRTWQERGRRYFHYATDVPIRNDFAISSAPYAVREARWRPPGDSGREVLIQVLHHPRHATNVERMVRSVGASLDYLTRHFGPYPHGQLRLVENPSEGRSLHAFPVNVSYGEGFSLFDAARDPRRIDFPFAVVAHEVAHQWWGNQLSPAPVEGGALLSESLAWYTAMMVVRETHGEEHLARLLDMMRETYLAPRPRAGAPLLRAHDWLSANRKGPFVMYALREYVGEDRVNAALRRLLRRHGAGVPPLPVSLDLYAELRAVTPDSLRPLLADLFEANTYWEFAAERAAAEADGAGGWRVAVDVSARKVTVDTAGAETEVPMNDLVEIGMYAAPEGGRPAATLYRRMHRLRSGRQRITVAVAGRPARVAVDPRGLLLDVEPGDNGAEVRPPVP